MPCGCVRGRLPPRPWPGGRWWWSCCCSFTLGVCSELEEHLLEPGAVGGAELGQGQTRAERDLPDLLGGGVGVHAAVRVGDREAGALQGGPEGREVPGAGDGAGGGE